jgi:alpha-L-fucosidase 2
MILPLHRLVSIGAHAAATLAITCVTTGANANNDAHEALTLHYDQPAAVWTEALPIGNGRLGAMVFGRPGEELLQLNEATLWSGGPVGTDLNPTAYNALLETRKALAGEDYEEAARLVRKIQGPYSQSYLPLGDLLIRQDLPGNPTSYRRDLNIRDGIASTIFTVNGVRYRREMFASAPDQVIVVRISTDKPRALNLDVTSRSELRGESTDANGVLILKGKAPAQVDPE